MDRKKKGRKPKRKSEKTITTVSRKKDFSREMNESRENNQRDRRNWRLRRSKGGDAEKKWDLGWKMIGAGIKKEGFGQPINTR